MNLEPSPTQARRRPPSAAPAASAAVAAPAAPAELEPASVVEIELPRCPACGSLYHRLQRALTDKQGRPGRRGREPGTRHAVCDDYAYRFKILAY